MTDWGFIFEKWILRQHRNVSHEPAVQKRLNRFKGDLFVDIGANQGHYSIPLARRFRRVYAFEPNPNVASVLIQKLKNSGIANVKVLEMALGNTIGTTLLYLDPHKGFEGSVDTILPVFDYKPNLIPGKSLPHVYVGKSGILVALSTYDSVIVDPSDLVKIDVEGAEFLVLEGMKRSIEEGRVKRVLVELNDRDRKPELEALLHHYNFEWLDPDHILGELNWSDSR